ncbi:DUF1016 N-terminal domain-containing protein [Pseudobutyrivibrio ruminis]|uniref:DUF1016 N-terminal domain-containing protein n=1 Tax=Pseudobutyrivibrio ruminis TaxID=46206 RepID=UPI001FA889F0
MFDSLSEYLTNNYGRGFSRSNVASMRQFYLVYKERDSQIVQSPIGQLTIKGNWSFLVSWTHNTSLW